MKWLKSFNENRQDLISKEDLEDLLQDLEDEFGLSADINFQETMVPERKPDTKVGMSFRKIDRIRVKLKPKSQRSVFNYSNLAIIKNSKTFEQMIEDLRVSLEYLGHEIVETFINRSWIEIIIKKI